jgi:polyribonucleotide nucleotidyltransferase
MVKVLAVEGNRIKLSRKALIKEQKAKLGQAAPVEGEEVDISASESQDAPSSEYEEHLPKVNQGTILIEGGDDFGDEGGEESDEETEPNFNRVDAAPAAGAPAAGAGHSTADSNNRRRRRRRPAGGGRGPNGGSHQG